LFATRRYGSQIGVGFALPHSPPPTATSLTHVQLTPSSLLRYSSIAVPERSGGEAMPASSTVPAGMPPIACGRT
jgi:hypothetical protein